MDSEQVVFFTRSSLEMSNSFAFNLGCLPFAFYFGLTILIFLNSRVNHLTQNSYLVTAVKETISLAKPFYLQMDA